VTGGGGYTKQNVARCWTVETGVLVDRDLPNGELTLRAPTTLASPPTSSPLFHMRGLKKSALFTAEQIASHFSHQPLPFLMSTFVF